MRTKRISIARALTFASLGLALAASAAQARPRENPRDDTEVPTGNPSPEPAPVEVKAPQIRVRIEIDSVTPYDLQEISGDEFYVLSAFTGAKSSLSDGRALVQNLHETPQTFVTAPVTIAHSHAEMRASRHIPTETAFEAVLASSECVLGALSAWEEDTGKDRANMRTWRNTMERSIQAEVKDLLSHSQRTGQTQLVNGTSLIWWARSKWEFLARVFGGDLAPFDEDDRIADSGNIVIPASGLSVEKRQWQVKDKDSSYTVHYRITRTAATPQTPQPQTPQPPQPQTPAPPTNYDLSSWVDEWETTYGRVKLALENNVLRGRLMKKVQGGLEREDAMLELRADGSADKLKGTSTYTQIQTQMTLEMGADRDSFTGTNLLFGEATPHAWSGRRWREDSTPTEPTTPTEPGTPTNPTGPIVPQVPTAPTSPRPSTSSGYLPLKNFEVRVDKVQPNIEGDKLEAFVTLRNRTQKEQLINGSVIQGVATDEDGVGILFMGFYQPEGAPTEIGGNTAMAPGAEIKVRLLVPVPEGTAPLKTMTLWERDSQPQAFDISNVRLPGLKPAANFAALNLKGGTGEWKAAGRTLDVRFEGFRKARDGSFEAFFTFKNTSESFVRTEVLDMHSSSLDIDLHDAGGQKARHDEVMRPNGNTAIPMNHVGVLPGSETKFRYRFRPKAGFAPARLSVRDRPSNTTVEWALPNN